jgi:hypothetical protein
MLLKMEISCSLLVREVKMEELYYYGILEGELCKLFSFINIYNRPFDEKEK